MTSNADRHKQNKRHRIKKSNQVNNYNQYDRRKDNHFYDSKRNNKGIRNNPNFKTVTIKENKPKFTDEQKKSNLDKELDQYFNKDCKLRRGLSKAATRQPAGRLQKTGAPGELINYNL